MAAAWVIFVSDDPSFFLSANQARSSIEENIFKRHEKNEFRRQAFSAGEDCRGFFYVF